MNETAIAGIRRGSRFSPNHIGNDAAIFQATVCELRKLGRTVNEYSEADLIEGKEIEEQYIFNMVRDRRSVRRLQQYENSGRRLLNSAYGIENCTREKMTRLLLEHHIPHPRSIIVPTDADPEAALREHQLHNCWIKRGDFHAIHREDVTYVRNRNEAQSILEEYALRGIRHAVINEHLAGDLVKFYGVAHTDFFFRFYPTAETHSKFGLEEINGTAKGIAFDEAHLKRICNEAARVLGIEIYGGDCIVSADDGQIRIIDFNDWPSFAPCRSQAAAHIAGRINALATEASRYARV
ncbi:MAG: hypothetical protein LBD21_04870 [Tannerellaceae bacterium]|jgi:hypothetical protein|nr:hypothetical protein [Tannerellaceae bacterium]